MPFEVIERLVKRAVQDRDLPLLGGDQPTLPERLQGDGHARPAHAPRKKAGA